ncbi:MAG: Uma2 family endonuclease [Trichodesmium sp.]
MILETQKTYYTPEEYLELEKKAEYKHEYRDGKIILITGGTTNHNKITGNFSFYFKLAKRGENYEIFMGDVRLWVEDYRLYTYPDFMVISGEIIYHGSGITTVTNPLLIVEVLSKSTKDYDRGDKFKYYRSIPSLKEYIMIDQYSFHVEQFAKNYEGKWVLTEYDSEAVELKLESIDFQIGLKDIYEGINFDVEDGE